jgi:hypothetical protein
MLFPPKKAGDPPSLLVEDGTNFTIEPNLKGLTVSKVRPRSVGAWLALCGIPSPQPPPRLADAAAFESVSSTEGLVELKLSEHTRRVGGYSAPFVRAVLKALDPQAPMPKSVHWRVAQDHSVKVVDPSTSSSIHNTPVEQAVHIESEVPVPAFMHEGSVYTKCVLLEDIIVGFGSTLVISVSPMIVNNFIMYGGSQVIVSTPYLNLDVNGTMQGGVPSVIHEVIGKNLAVDVSKLRQIPVAGL